MKNVFAKISIGELIDKITILELKLQFIEDKNKKDHISNELQQLTVVAKDIDVPPGLRLSLELTNGDIWDVEDSLRKKEQERDFGPEFVELARSVYLLNDKRSEIKKDINIWFNSEIIEEKSYG
jgi:hypothetical protein